MSHDLHTSSDPLTIRVPTWFAEKKTEDIPHTSRVRLSELNIDRGYQRESRRQKIAALLRNWDWVKFGTLSVSRRVGGPRAGQLFVWDGQHRYLAALEKFPDSQVVPCIITPMTCAEEARHFAEQDKDSSNVNAATKFRAMMQAQDPETLDIVSIVEGAGFHITTNNSKSLSGRGITAVTSIAKAYREGGPERLALLLQIINSAWPPGVTGRNSSDILNGLGHFLDTYPEAKMPRLVEKLSDPTASPLRIMQNSAAYRGVTAGGNTTAVSRAILDAYNKHSQANRLEYISRKSGPRRKRN